jgi:thiamine biosynthesis lipoprotein
MMRETRILMGMPITVEVLDATVAPDSSNSPSANLPAINANVDIKLEIKVEIKEAIDAVYTYFEYVDGKFSTYKENSEISLINRKELALEDASSDMRKVFALCEETKQKTGGYFDIAHHGQYDPSGLVKGWSIQNAATLLRQKGFANFYVEAGGDIEMAGENHLGQKWRVGIRNPFNLREIVKVLSLTNCGVATSGTYVRGQHIYDPIHNHTLPDGVVSLTVIGPNIYEADRFATAAFAMGFEGIYFIESLEGFEGYLINQQGQATFTSGFAEYIRHDERN